MPYLTTERLDYIRPDGAKVFKGEDHGYFPKDFDVVEWVKARYPGEWVRILTFDERPPNPLDKIKIGKTQT